jgi:hypothetical protein
MILHEFSMGDVEDPYLYAAFPISDWQKTDKGKWVMEHAQGEIVFHCMPCPDTYGYRVLISGELEERDEIIYRLKYT